MIVDSVNLFSDAGLVVLSRQGGLDSGRELPAIGQSPFAFRRFVLGRQATRQREIRLRGAVTADLDLTLSAGKTQLETRFDRLKWRIRPRRTARLEWTDFSDRFWDVEFLELIARGFRQDWIVPARNVEIKMLAIDPRAFSLTETTLDDPGALPRKVDIIPIGNAPQGGVITITGNAGTPLATGWVLQYRDESDAVLKSITWNGQALAATDSVRITLEEGKVELDTGAGFVNAIDDAEGDLVIIVDPEDGADDSFLDQVAAKVPDFNLTGTGTVDKFEYVYRARLW